MTIYIYYAFRDGFVIHDDTENKMRYILYTKRDALRKFKAEFGYTGKRGITIIDMT